jgi:DNA-directed RNA polymerase specialized sigma24 family protein
MSKFWQDHGSSIRLPQSIHKDLSRLRKCERELERQLESTPSDQQLAVRMKLSVSEVRQLKILQHNHETKTREESPNESEEVITEFISKNDELDRPDGLVERWRIWDAVKAASSQLKPLELQVGALSWLDELNVAEIAARLGQTETNTSRALRRARYKMRNALTEQGITIDHVKKKRKDAPKKARAHSRGAKAKKDDDSGQLQALFRKAQYKTNLERMMAVALNSLRGQKITRTRLLSHLRHSLKAARLKPISDDPLDNDPAELAYFVLKHLEHDKLVAEKGSPAYIKITAAGFKWLYKIRRRKSSA